MSTIGGQPQRPAQEQLLQAAPTSEGRPQPDSTVLARIRQAEVRRSVRRALVAVLMLVPAVGRDPLQPIDQPVVLVLTLLVALFVTQTVHRWVIARAGQPTRGGPQRWRTLVLLPAWAGFGCAVVAARLLWAGWATIALVCCVGSVALAWLLLRRATWIHEMDDEPYPQPSGFTASTSTSAAGNRYHGVSIACSGGGIRAAAFCLGGLQRLRLKDGTGSTLYQRADRVYAVSGGSYIATALHLARCRSEATESVQDTLFQPGSPEEDWLRRRSKYLLPTGSTLVGGVLSLLYGIAVNLTLVGITLYLTAAWVGWVHAGLGAICSGQVVAGSSSCLSDGSQATLAPMAGQWALYGWGLLGAGLLWFVASKTIAKYSGRSRLLGAGATRALVSGGLAVALLLVLLPWMLVSLNNATLSNRPTMLAARAMSTLQLATPAGCVSRIEQQFGAQARRAWYRASPSSRNGSLPFTYGACGHSWTDDAVVFSPVQHPATLGKGSWCVVEDKARPSFCDDPRGSGRITFSDAVASWAAAIAALAAAVRGMLGGTTAGTTAGTRRSRLSDVVRRVLLPWAAAAALVLACVVIVLRLLRQEMLAPGQLSAPQAQVTVLCAMGAILVLSDATLSSLHPFYRERLSATFLVRRNGRTAEPLPFREPTHVADSHPGTGPDLVVCCAANIQDRDFVPAARGCAPFQFRTDGGARIGISDSRLPAGRMQPAESYSARSDPQGYDTTLAAAMAASGAAFSPQLGRLNAKVRPYRMLLALANARLGVWLPNPYLVLDHHAQVEAQPKDSRDWLRWWWMRLARPGPLRIFKEAFVRLTIDDSRIYVTDGGHYDNTAIVEALRDKPATLIALDASADAPDSLDALGDAIVTARMDLGLEIRPVLGCSAEQIRRDPSVCARVLSRGGGPALEEPALARQGWLHLQGFRVDEPEVAVCDLWFVKNVRTSTPQLELDTYANDHLAFPVTSTDDQFYGEYDFEAYRLLGYVNTDAMLNARDMPASAARPPLIDVSAPAEQSVIDPAVRSWE